MKKVLVLGANGATARIVIDRLLKNGGYELLLYLRNSKRLTKYQSNPNVKIIDGDVQDLSKLEEAMQGVDIVYSNVGGVDLAKSTAVIIKAMQVVKVKRLLFFSALGALHEVPGKFGQWNEQAIAAYLPGFRKSDELLTNASGITVTQFRPAWLSDRDEIDYEITGKNEKFKGTEVSRQSVADFVVKLIEHPDQYLNDSVGLDKPGTNADKPTWI